MKQGWVVLFQGYSILDLCSRVMPGLSLFDCHLHCPSHKKVSSAVKENNVECRVVCLSSDSQLSPLHLPSCTICLACSNWNTSELLQLNKKRLKNLYHTSWDNSKVEILITVFSAEAIKILLRVFRHFIFRN